MDETTAGDAPEELPEEFQAARLSADQWRRLLVAPKTLVVLLAAAGVAVGGVWLVDWLLGEDWDGLGGLVAMVVVGIAEIMLRSDVRRLAQQRFEQLRRATPPVTPVVVSIDRARLGATLRRAHLVLLAGTLVGALLAGGCLALAAVDTWQLVRAVGIARGGATTTGTVVGVVGGFSPGYRVAFATDGGRAEAVVTPKDDPVWEPGQQVPVVYDPGWPERAVLAEDARWFSDPWTWLFWVGGIALAVTFARLFRKERRALQGAAGARLDAATVATVLGVGGGPAGDERRDLLLRFPHSGQQPERRLVFPPLSVRARRRLVREDQVVVFGEAVAGAHVVVQTADEQVLLPRGPLRLPE